MTIDLNILFNKKEKLDKRSVQAILGAFKKAHRQSFDYLRYKQSINSLLDMGMDEGTSFKSAFATASTIGVTKDLLLGSMDKYLQILQKESESFTDALSSQIEEKVNGKKEYLDNLRDKIKENKENIQKLQDEIDVYQHKIDNVDNDIAVSKEKIDTTKNKFLDAYNDIKETIQNDITLINQYL